MKDPHDMTGAAPRRGGMIGDIARALAQLSDPRFLRVVMGAVALTIALLAGFVGGGASLAGWLLPETLTLPWFGSVDLAVGWLSWAALGLLLILSVVLMVPVASVFVGFFLESIAEAVEARYYPHLPPVTPLPLSAAIGDALRFLGVMIVVNVVALVIYLLSTVLAPFVFWAVNGYLLGREYFQLVAARRLGHERATRLRKRHSLRIWSLGAVIAVPLSVPVVNLFVPVLGMAAFCHMFQRLSRSAQ